MSQNTPTDSEAELIATLNAEIKTLKSALQELKIKEKVTTDLLYQSISDCSELNTRCIAFQQRIYELENPHGQRSSGLSWLGKVIQIIRRIDRPLRAQEITAELLSMDEGDMLNQKPDPARYLSVVLANGVKKGRLHLFKLAGTRGGYYALEEWLDTKGELDEKRKSQLL